MWAASTGADALCGAALCWEVFFCLLSHKLHSQVVFVIASVIALSTCTMGCLGVQRLRADLAAANGPGLMGGLGFRELCR